MTEVTRAQQAAVDYKKLDEQFNTGSLGQKAQIKMIMGLSLIMESCLDRSVKADAIVSAVEMFAALIKVDTLSTIVECENGTEAPFGTIVGVMGQEASKSAHHYERRFGTMMELFIEEVEKRTRG